MYNNLQWNYGNLNSNNEKPNDETAEHIRFKHIFSQLTELKVQMLV